MTPRLQIENLPLDGLIPYARNSRTHDPEQVAQIAASIREFGFTNPVLIDSAGGIIAGHGRVMAARLLDLAEVPCIRLGHLTDTQRRAYVIADNRIALNSGWDEDMLRLELSDLQLEGFDMDLMGFGQSELDDLLASFTGGNTPGEAANIGGESSDQSSSGVAGITMKIGKATVPLTEDEHRGLIDLLKEYTVEYGLEYGFGAWLVEKARGEA